MLFLGIDTATIRGSIALAGVDGIIDEQCLEERARHTRDLLERIDRLLGNAGRAPADLRGIGVAIGPGSFTGVRIGMATGKGMAYGLGIGLTGLSTLEALARAVPAERIGSVERLAAVIEAGRGEVYAAVFRRRGDDLERLLEDRSWRPAELASRLDNGVALVGNGIDLLLHAVPDLRQRATIIVPAPPNAGAIALQAAHTIDTAAGYRVGTLGPNYVRPSDAEVSRRT